MLTINIFDFLDKPYNSYNNAILQRKRGDTLYHKFLTLSWLRSKALRTYPGFNLRIEIH